MRFISVAGAYLSWVLLAAEILFTASKSDTMPRFLSRQNAKDVPANALWLTNLVVQAFLIITLFTEYAFTLALELTSSMILIPYFLVAAYAFKLAWTRETYDGNPKGRRNDLARAAVAVVYTAGLVYAAGTGHLLLTTVIYGPGTVLYFIARREQNRPAFANAEVLVFALVVAGAIMAIFALSTGRITI